MSREMRSAACAEAVWSQLCARVWRDKAFVPERARQLRAAGDSRGAIKLAMKDSVRTLITREEFSSMAWQTRRKACVGPEMCSLDPWQCGRACLQAQYHGDGVVLKEPVEGERPSPRPWPAPLPLPAPLRPVAVWAFHDPEPGLQRRALPLDANDRAPIGGGICTQATTTESLDPEAEAVGAGAALLPAPAQLGLDFGWHVVAVGVVRTAAKRHR